MDARTRWPGETDPDHSTWYIERFRKMAAEGADLAGEARLLDAMLPRSARVLDAGCGPGRLGGELAARGHTVVGVDVDPALIAAAEADHPGPRWLVGDLAELDLAAHGETEPFDAAVLAGNVLGFVAPGSEPRILARLAGHLKPDGFLAVGLGSDRGYPPADMDADAVSAGLRLEHRFATWDLRPYGENATFAVTIYRT
ncbi:class I SAM-dependent methyltransferase [Sporichthya brevicatena]|uniref:Class I SAM-dependent methyltransferase n=1 Tax=Sporichthya brevicatena TaxID=171442 RepID=A0ABN1H7R2_9ACTN